MNNSAMLRAFGMLRKRPVLILLILPMHAVSLLSLAFLPDLTKLLDFNALTSGSAMLSMQASSIVSSLVSSLASVISFAGLFVLLPPAVELMADGAAGAETAPGWYGRGLRRHWWKPVVVSLITGAILGAIVFVLYIAMIFLIIIVMIPFMGSLSWYGSSPSASGAESALSGAMPAITAVAVIFGLFIAAISLLIQSFFGLFLPALADRGFGGAFRLMFSRKGLRKFPRMLGGMALISLVSGLIVTTLGALRILIVGIPEGQLGPVIALWDFIRSAPGILGMLLVSVIGLLQYPFQFGVYQMVKDEEQAGVSIQH